ncbi:Uncharacterized protein TCM_045057 [Theobroma cacao]|uniref:Reverse transcriptase domain-containing protein n=1 Tax=Theobroma cacao TaxID=3641 RepID=A0A061FY83_THECC|nr:Uncharacterized protein TCM_045057 [Theobroma cacao]
MVAQKWSSTLVNGTSGFCLKVKLNRLKTHLKHWNKVSFGNIDDTINELENKVEEFDIICNLKDLTDNECLAQKQVVQQLCARPRSVLVITTSLESQLMVHGSLIRQSSHDAQNLEALISMEELKFAIWSCDGSKAPGPDGFNLNFFKHYWSFIKSELFDFISDFMTRGKLDKGINSSFIALIPKTPNPTALTEYWPISLINSLYKILAKLLANRLFRGISITSFGLSLSHLQFVNDTIIFMHADTQGALNLKWMLHYFELASGLHINFQKLSAFLIGISNSLGNELSALLHCKVGSLPLSYLGIPLGANPKRASTWDPIVNRFKKKLALWQRKYLSLGEQLTNERSQKLNGPRSNASYGWRSLTLSLRKSSSLHVESVSPPTSFVVCGVANLRNAVRTSFSPAHSVGEFGDMFLNGGESLGVLRVLYPLLCKRGMVALLGIRASKGVDAIEDMGWWIDPHLSSRRKAPHHHRVGTSWSPPPTELMAILKALKLFTATPYTSSPLIIESDSCVVLSWVYSVEKRPGTNEVSITS